ncbi:carboxymuconolactone decarboxylase family protein [Ancylobacter terrae]|uniref:carboxymuconolactone decarboxylase family protein n=1 Tax=Ancylobacter sp. sgz301288 TaxID=3342077 RepID=UPI00385D4087
MSRFGISEPEWNEEQQALARRLRESARGKIGLPFLNLLSLPELARCVADVGACLRFKGVLAGDVRELVIVTVAEHWHCTYEWTSHAKLAKEEGLSPSTLADLAKGQEGADLSSAQRKAAAAARAVLQRGKLDDMEFKELADAVGREGALEVIALCGYYSMLAMVINAGFPDAEQPDWTCAVETSLAVTG